MPHKDPEVRRAYMTAYFQSEKYRAYEASRRDARLEYWREHNRKRNATLEYRLQQEIRRNNRFNRNDAEKLKEVESAGA